MDQSSRALVMPIVASSKAGAAYLALDPKLPKERIQFMLGASRVRTVLTLAHLAKALDIAQPEERVALVILDTQWDEISAETSQNNLNTAVGLENLAYV